MKITIQIYNEYHVALTWQQILTADKQTCNFGPKIKNQKRILSQWYWIASSVWRILWQTSNQNKDMHSNRSNFIVTQSFYLFKSITTLTTTRNRCVFL